MIKKDELATPTSCLNKAADDEPIFVLRAHDDIASDIVREWAWMYRSRKLLAREFLVRERAKFDEAIRLASDMDNWRIASADPKV